MWNKYETLTEHCGNIWIKKKNINMREIHLILCISLFNKVSSVELIWIILIIVLLPSNNLVVPQQYKGTSKSVDDINV